MGVSAVRAGPCMPVHATTERVRGRLVPNYFEAPTSGSQEVSPAQPILFGLVTSGMILALTAYLVTMAVELCLGRVLNPCADVLPKEVRAALGDASAAHGSGRGPSCSLYTDRFRLEASSGGGRSSRELLEERPFGDSRSSIFDAIERPALGSDVVVMSSKKAEPREIGFITRDPHSHVAIPRAIVHLVVHLPTR